MSIETKQSLFEDEIFFSLRKQRNQWAAMAIGAISTSALLVFGFTVLLPLKEIRPYVVMVDKTTGEAEKVVELKPVPMEQQDAVVQAELVSYVVDRETYDQHDNATRITDIFTRSKNNAADTLKAQWDSGSEGYPPKLYEKDRVLVTVKSVAVTPDAQDSTQGTATIRIIKSREVTGSKKVDRSYVVTISYQFEPTKAVDMLTVWKNPLGFSVGEYRIDAETITDTTVVR